MLFDPEIQRLSQYLSDGQEGTDWDESGSRFVRQVFEHSDAVYYLVLPRAFRHEYDNFVSALEQLIGPVGRSKLEDQSLWEKSPAFEVNELGFLQCIIYYHEEFERPTYTALFDAIVAWKAIRNRCEDARCLRLDQWCDHFLDTLRSDFIGHIRDFANQFHQMDSYEALFRATHYLRCLADNLCIPPSVLGNDCASVALTELTRCQSRLIEFTDRARARLMEEIAQQREYLRNLPNITERVNPEKMGARWVLSICRDLGIDSLRDRLLEFDRAANDFYVITGPRQEYLWPIFTNNNLNAFFHDPNLQSTLSRIEETCSPPQKIIWPNPAESDIHQDLAGGNTWVRQVGTRFSDPLYSENPLHQVVLMQVFFAYVVTGLQDANLERSLTLFESRVTELDSVLKFYVGCDLHFANRLVHEYRTAGKTAAGLRIGHAYHVSRSFRDLVATVGNSAVSGWFVEKVMPSIDAFCTSAVINTRYDMHHFFLRIGGEMKDAFGTEFAIQHFMNCGYIIRALTENEEEDDSVSQELLDYPWSGVFATDYADFRRLTEAQGYYEEMISRWAERYLLKIGRFGIGKPSVSTRLLDLKWPQIMRDIVLCRVVLSLSQSYTTVSGLARKLGHTNEQDRTGKRGGLEGKLHEMVISVEIRKDPTKFTILSETDQQWIAEHKVIRY